MTGTDWVEQPASTLAGFISHRERALEVLAVTLLLMGIVLWQALQASDVRLEERLRPDGGRLEDADR
jgi:hypothetical protein